MSIFRRERRRCKSWTDEDLTRALHEAATRERESLVTVLVRLGEFDRRELDLKRGYPNLYEYCMRVLKHSRSGAARRIAAARAGRRYPSLLAMIEAGQLSLVGAAMLQPHLKPQNRRKLLRQARGRSQDEIARLVAEFAPEPPRRDSIRILSAGKPVESDSPPPAAPAVASAAPVPAVAPAADLFGGTLVAPPEEPPPHGALYAASLVLTEATRALLLRAQEVLRHKVPRGEFDPILRMALELLLDKVDRDRRVASEGRGEAKAAAGRRPSEAAKQRAWERDGGQCAFVGPDGIRCTARAWLEFDHRQPFALGGSSEESNLQPMCRPHNALRGRMMFGGGRPG